MKRILFVLSAGLIVAAMMAITAFPAFAANERSSCVGTAVSTSAKTEKPGFVGKVQSSEAQRGGRDFGQGTAGAAQFKTEEVEDLGGECILFSP